MKNDILFALLSNWRRGPLFNAAGEGAGGAGATGAGSGANGGGTQGAVDAGASGNGGPQGDGTGAGGDATGTTTTAADPAAWVYELSYPDAFGVEGERLEEWTSHLREIGVTPEQAAKIAEKEIAWFEANQQATQELLKSYDARVTEDKFLSENWDLTLKRMDAGMTAAKVSDDFRAFLQSPEGIVVAAHPDILRAFAMLGQLSSNDKFETGASTQDSVPAHRSWYGNTTPETKRG
jgi:hypothetical protein